MQLTVNWIVTLKFFTLIYILGLAVKAGKFIMKNKSLINTSG